MQLLSGVEKSSRRFSIRGVNSLKDNIRKHPILSYFVIAYSISWLGAFLVVAPELLQGKPVPYIDGLIMFPVMLLGPSISGVLMTRIVDGKSGLKELSPRLKRWRVGANWYAALLIPPVLIMIILIILSSYVSPIYSSQIFAYGIGFGVLSGFVEEIGWTGYAFPRMKSSWRNNAIGSGILLGVLWGTWHAPVVDYLGAAYPHGIYWIPYFLTFILTMTAMRVIIAWIYSNTTSVLLAQLMHASSTGFLVVLSPPKPISPAQETFWYLIYAVSLWIIVAILASRYGKGLIRRSGYDMQSVKEVEKEELVASRMCYPSTGLKNALLTFFSKKIQSALRAKESF